MSLDEKKGYTNSNKSYYHTIIIGGGQAGLAAGYFLSLRGKDFIILDNNKRTGDSWRNRWNGLKLFTPSKINALPGMPFPKPGNYLPTKDETADYLETYARHFNLPVRHGVKVENLSHNGEDYQIFAGSSTFTARNVIVATGPFQKPYIPIFANDLDPSILQLHSSTYRSPKQITPQSVLIVGAGNSGAEIALELVRAGKKVWLAGRDVGRIPANGALGKAFGGWPMWWFMNHVLTVNTPIGRKVREKELNHGTPLGRSNRQEIADAGVKLTPRVSGVQSGMPRIEDGRTLPVDCVVWATGFRPDYHWIDLPIFDEHGHPHHWRGVVNKLPGLYFVGLLFQTGLSSSLLGGVGADAAYISNQIVHNGHAV